MQTQLNQDQMIENAVKAGFSREEAIAFLKKEGTWKEPATNITKSEAASMPKERLPGDVEAHNLSKGFVGKYKLPIGLLAGAAAAGGGNALGLGKLGVGLLSSLGMSASDAAIDTATGERPNLPITDALGTSDEKTNAPFESILQNTLMNEGIGYGVGKAFTGAKNLFKEADAAPMSRASSYLGEALNYGQRGVATVRDKVMNAFGLKMPVSKGSVSGELSKYDTTLGQYLASRGRNRSSNVVDFTENMFAKRAKIDSINNSTDKVIAEANDFVKQISGKAKVDINSTEALSKSIQMKASVNLENLENEIASVDTDIKTVQSAIAANPKDKALQGTLAKLKSQMNDLWKAKTNFYPGVFAEKGDSIKDLVIERPVRLDSNLNFVNDFTRSPNPIVDIIASDAAKVQRLFNTGEIKINGVTITSESPKKDLAGQVFSTMFNSAYDKTKHRVDTVKLRNMWEAYSVSDAGRKVFSNAQQRADVAQFFESAGKVLEKVGDPGASKYLTLRLATGSVAIGSSIASGMTGGTMAGLSTGGTLVGVAFGLHQLGKLMTNPDVSRLMIAAVSGGPLNMAPAVASRIIGRALRGQSVEVEIKASDGSVSKVPGKIDATGKFVSDVSEWEGNKIKVKGFN